MLPTAPFGTNFDDPGTFTTDTRGYFDASYHHDVSANTDVEARAYYDAYRYHGDYAYGGTRFAGTGT